MNANLIGAVIFVIFFLLFLAITLSVHGLLPGSMTHAWLGIPQTEYVVLGIPAWLLINAIVNGVFWGFVVWLIYSLVRLATSKREKKVKVEISVPPTPEKA